MKNDFYIVGIIPEPPKSRISHYQEEFSKIYDLYEGQYPELHITLSRLSYGEKEELDKFIDKLVSLSSCCKPLTIEIDGASCFGPPYKSVNFNVKQSSKLEELSKNIAGTALSCGIESVLTPQRYQYHISVANSFFAKREWPEQEYEQACTLLKSQNFAESFILSRLELWLPKHDNYKIAGFTLGK
jgi:2'',5'' RNA ligase family.